MPDSNISIVVAVAILHRLLSIQKTEYQYQLVNNKKVSLSYFFKLKNISDLVLLNGYSRG